jgi:hypothetical protein
MIPEEPDPLETKLRRLRPQPMSAGLRGRIAAGISESGRARARFVRGSLVALTAVFLVSVTLIVTLRGPAPERDRATAQRQADVGPALPAGEPARKQERPAEPSLRLTLHRLAEAETPEQIDAILDQCAPRWLVFTQADRDCLIAPDL